MANEIISLRVNQDIKKRMRMLQHINWSALIRKTIENQLEKENAFDMEKAKIALRNIEKIRKSKIFDNGKSSTEIIREWRNKRK